MQNWQKLGRVFDARPGGAWRCSHAAVPTVEPLDAHRVRVYFGARNASQQASIGYFDLDLRDPNRTPEVSDAPVVGPGELGTFDDSGVLPSWMCNRDGHRYLYYIGWNLGVTVPFRNFIGLAQSPPGSAAFERVSRAPIADRDDHDPFFYTNPCVLHDGGRWRMWYLSAVRWEQAEDGPKHYYHIKHDTSDDGVRWHRSPTVAIDFEHDGEYAISRPCVLRDADGYRMWYSFRAGPAGETYRIGYAESPDGTAWTRLDDRVRLAPSSEGWDSEMVEYPFVFDHDGRRYMLYNGNGFGRTGIGLAVLS